MKRMFVLVATGLLVLTVAAPTAAAPALDKNKHLSEITIDCTDSEPVDLGIFTVAAKSTPGWPLDVALDSVNTPIQYRASTITFYENDVEVWSFDNAAPPGLEPKLIGPCEFTLEWDVYRWENTNAYFTLPRPWE